MKDENLTKEMSYKKDANKRIYIISRIKTLEGIQKITSDADEWIRRQETIDSLTLELESIDIWADINNYNRRNKSKK